MLYRIEEGLQCCGNEVGFEGYYGRDPGAALLQKPYGPVDRVAATVWYGHLIFEAW